MGGSCHVIANNGSGLRWSGKALDKAGKDLEFDADNESGGLLGAGR